MQKVAYIIPGFGESHLRQSGYDKIAVFFGNKGFAVRHANIRWKQNKPIDFEEYTRQFLRKYKKAATTYILGFSFGAMIAFLTASKTRPQVLILCSLSPYFIEDYKQLDPKRLRWWKKNFKNDFQFNETAKNISAKTYIIVGNKETKSVITRAKTAKRKIKNSNLVIAKGAKHNIGQKEYLKTLGKLIGKL